MIHLDANFLIRAIEPGSSEDRAITGWYDAGETFAISAVAWAEFMCGPLDQSELDTAAGIIRQYIDFTPAQAEIAAHLFNQSGRRRGLFADCMIAAAAIAERAPIATGNVKDFRRFEAEGLTLALA